MCAVRLKRLLGRGSLHWIQGYISYIWSKLDQDSELRRQGKENEKYKRSSFLIPLLLLCALVLIGVGSLLAPPKYIPQFLKKHSNDYFPIVTGFVEFTKLGSGKKHSFSFPNWEIHDLPDFDPKKIFYSFDANIENFKPDEKFLGLLIPALAGHGVFRINDKKIVTSNNIPQLLPINERKLHIEIEVSSNGNTIAGIHQSFPLLVAKIGDLKEFLDVLQEETISHGRATLAELVAAFLFLMLFINLPAKPELLIFVFVFLSNITFGYVDTLAIENKIPSFGIVMGHRYILGTLILVRSITIFWFLLEFFRFSSLLIKRLVMGAVVSGFIIVPVIFLSLTRVLEGGNKLSIFQFSVESFFLIWCLGISTVKLCYLTFHLRHRQRALLAGILVLSVTYTVAINLYSYFSSSTQINDFVNHLITYFSVTLVVIVEFARTEKDRNELASNLPREEQEKYLRRFGKLKMFHDGFVLLVDAIGFSTLQRSCPTDKQGLLTHLINCHLLKMFESENVSILNGTGDGFYFAWEGPLSFEKLDIIITTTAHLVSTSLILSGQELDFESNRDLKFRCALGYGRYFVGISKTGKMSKDYSAGAILTDLARIIDTGSASSFRVLLNETALDTFTQFTNLKRYKLIAKHGKEYSFIEYLESIKPAA